MSRKTTRFILSSILILQILMMVCLSNAVAQNDSTERDDSNSIQSFFNKYVFLVAIPFVFASINYAIDLFKKDKILKQLLKKYIVFEMKKDNKRHRGTMRLESNGLEIISEESRQRGHAPSYIFRGKEMEDIVAYIRYLDSMNEREKLERDWDLERVYHPRLPTRIRRKIRNFGVALKDSVNNTFDLIWGGIKKSAALRSVTSDKDAAEDLDAAAEELRDYAMEESYERLIERLVGTRVKVKIDDKVDKVDKDDKDDKDDKVEYIGVLKEYTKDHIYLMDVKQPDGKGYKDEWNVELIIEKNKRLNWRDDRGLRSRIEGDRLIFENNAPYEIQMWGLVYQHDGDKDAHDWKWNHRIAPFSTQSVRLQPRPKNHKVGPFTHIVTHERRTYRSFKQLHLKFRSFRDSDIVFPRRLCKITESAEKYQPELLDLGGLTETMLATKKKEQDIEFVDKDGNPIRGINIVHGYITNVNEDRIDIKEIDHSYGRRWSVEHAFHRFDDKLRKVGPLTTKVSPFHRSRMATQTYLINKTENKKPEQNAMSPLLYTPTTPRIKPYKKPQLPIKVLALTGNVTEAEFPVLQQFEFIREHHVIYESVKNLWTDEIARTHLLWIGHGEIYKEGYRLSIDDEHRIKDFVRRGGIAIISGQDVKDVQKRRRGVGWIPEPLIGVEHDETLEFTPTGRGKKERIFRMPNSIQSGQIKLDDMWRDEMGKYIPLATAPPTNGGENLSQNGGKDAAILMLQFQKGLYIITSLKNETEADVQVNRAMMENLLCYSVKWLDRHKHEKLYYTHA